MLSFIRQHESFTRNLSAFDSKFTTHVVQFFRLYLHFVTPEFKNIIQQRQYNTAHYSITIQLITALQYSLLQHYNTAHYSTTIQLITELQYSSLQHYNTAHYSITIQLITALQYSSLQHHNTALQSTTLLRSIVLRQGCC